MKRFGLAIASCTLASGAAFAADLPSRKPAPPIMAVAPVWSWTGFYVGLNAGATFGGDNNVTIVGANVAAIPAAVAVGIPGANAAALTGVGSGNNNKIGFIGGGQIGYNWQFGSMVAGLEADIQGLAASRGATSVVGIAPLTVAGFNTAAFQTVTNKVDWLGTVRGRLGWSITPSFLLYATGGLAYGGVKSTATSFYSIPGAAPAIFGFGTATNSTTRVGWTIGAGGEWMFSPNWSAKIEYLYYDLGSFTYINPITQNQPGGAGFVASDVSQIRVRNNGHIVRAGVNYRFNWGGAGPVVARY